MIARTGFLIVSLLLAVPAQAALFTMPVPQALEDFVTSKTGISLRDIADIQIVENDDPIFKNEDARYTEAGGAEKDGVIYLPVRSAVHFQEPKIQALIVHELTHVAQRRSGNKYACAAQKEAEAYRHQIAYLKEQGQFPYRPSEKEIALMALCKSGS